MVQATLGDRHRWVSSCALHDVLLRECWLCRWASDLETAGVMVVMVVMDTGSVGRWVIGSVAESELRVESCDARIGLEFVERGGVGFQEFFACREMELLLLLVVS